VADEEGMLGMREAGMARVADGTTSLEELLRALG
jgi:type II secretory ATPase GspE/PulE/Tfp pilus assembly ATPase PilB-like protein